MRQSLKVLGLVGLAMLALTALASACDDGEDDDSSTTVAVEGVDFAFDGVPATLPEGRVTLEFSNGGAEFHEMVLVRLPEGMTLEQAMELPEEEAPPPIGIVFAQPGEQGAGLTATLEAGNYAMVCFIENEQGPHAFQGMVAELTIEG